MPLDKDRYPTLGRRRTFATFEEVIAHVRASWPTAGAEGSTGSERSWAVGRHPDDLLVAHSWSPGGRGDKWHVRVLVRADAPPHA